MVIVIVIYVAPEFEQWDIDSAENTNLTEIINIFAFTLFVINELIF